MVSDYTAAVFPRLHFKHNALNYPDSARLVYILLCTIGLLHTIEKDSGKSNLVIRFKMEIINEMTFLYSYSDEELQQNLLMISMKTKEKLFGTTEQFEEIHEEHRKILVTIENALHKINSECTHISEQHKYKVQQLTEKLIQLENSNTDKMAMLNCRDDLLRAKLEMLYWNKTNKKTQVRSM